MRAALVGLGAAAALVGLGGCGAAEPDDGSTVGVERKDDGSSTITAYDDDPRVLNIVAGSEQSKVLKDVVVPWCEDEGLTCNYQLLGSVDQARLLQTGQAPYDAFWFASSVFAQLGDEQSVLRDTKPMFVTPIVFAGWKSEMERLGLTSDEATIGDIIDVVESGKTTTWATNPTQSNSGATTLFAFLNHFAGNKPTEQLTMDQLASSEVREGIKAFVQSIDKTPPSTGTMMDDCVEQPTVCKTVFTYEDLVIEKNQELVREGREPFSAVYPRGSLAISDAPLGFFPHGENDDKLTAFRRLQAYLLSDAGQAKVRALGRRPAGAIGLTLSNADPAVFNPDWGIEATVREPTVVYPKAQVIQTALDNYQLAYRRPVDVVYCIDGSGSMGENGGWKGVERAAGLLFDPAQARRYLLQVSDRDVTTVIVFDAANKGGPWTVRGNSAPALIGLRDDVLALEPDGDTGLFRCLGGAADHFRSDPAAGRRQLVIAMTDGMDTVGEGGEVQRLAQMGVPVVAIGFSDAADMATLERIAAATSGAAIGSSDMVKALREATSYK